MPVLFCPAQQAHEHCVAACQAALQGRVPSYWASLTPASGTRDGWSARASSLAEGSRL